MCRIPVILAQMFILAFSNVTDSLLWCTVVTLMFIFSLVLAVDVDNKIIHPLLSACVYRLRKDKE